MANKDQIDDDYLSLFCLSSRAHIDAYREITKLLILAVIQKSIYLSNSITPRPSFSSFEESILFAYHNLHKGLLQLRMVFLDRASFPNSFLNMSLNKIQPECQSPPRLHNLPECESHPVPWWKSHAAAIGEIEACMKIEADEENGFSFQFWS